MAMKKTIRQALAKADHKHPKSMERMLSMKVAKKTAKKARVKTKQPTAAAMFNKLFGGPLQYECGVDFLNLDDVVEICESNDEFVEALVGKTSRKFRIHMTMLAHVYYYRKEKPNATLDQTRKWLNEVVLEPNGYDPSAETKAVIRQLCKWISDHDLDKISAAANDKRNAKIQRRWALTAKKAKAA